ncbi:MAG: hypothetical protein RR356_04750 [Bacteroidales bacterium]
MTHCESYLILGKIVILHEYYSITKCPVNLVLNDISSKWLQNADIIFRQTQHNEWMFFMEKSAIAYQRRKLILKETPILKLAMVPLNQEFYYVTEHTKTVSVIPNENDLVDITNSFIPKVWKELAINISQWTKSNTKNSIDILIPSCEKYWEYFIIPKRDWPSYPLSIKEENNNIVFQQKEMAILPDGSKAYRYTSLSSIKMTQSNRYIMKLLEIRKGGEKTICASLPHPTPVNRSIDHSQNTISHYYYL